MSLALLLDSGLCLLRSAVAHSGVWRSRLNWTAVKYIDCALTVPLLVFLVVSKHFLASTSPWQASPRVPTASTLLLAMPAPNFTPHAAVDSCAVQLYMFATVSASLACVFLAGIAVLLIVLMFVDPSETLMNRRISWFRLPRNAECQDVSDSESLDEDDPV